MAIPGLRFAFAFDPRYRRILWLLGITPARSWVAIAAGRLDVRFGSWRFRTTIDNIDCARVTGPYRAIRAIGPHISIADHGMSFGSNAASGVCMTFREAVRGREMLGLVSHPGLTVTVADIDGLLAAVGRPAESS